MPDHHQTKVTKDTKRADGMAAAMDRIRALFAPAKPAPDEYAPLTDDDDSDTLEGSVYAEEVPFSWIEYSIFALIGVAMLWAWCVRPASPFPRSATC